MHFSQVTMFKRFRHIFTSRSDLIFNNYKTNARERKKISGSEIVFKSLVRNNVDHAFIHPGGSIMPTIDKFYNSQIKYTINSHEQNCGHSATVMQKQVIKSV